MVRTYVHTYYGIQAPVLHVYVPLVRVLPYHVWYTCMYRYYLAGILPLVLEYHGTMVPYGTIMVLEYHGTIYLVVLEYVPVYV